MLHTILKSCVYRPLLHQLRFYLNPGDVQTFNNKRFAHGREEFKLNGGVRHLQVRVQCILSYPNLSGQHLVQIGKNLG